MWERLAFVGEIMKKYRCKRCGHAWYPRKPEKSLLCPKCKSAYWDREKVRK